jgi:hypothetical protein
MLHLARDVFKYDNLFQTVFSSKAVRAATSIDMMAKEILLKNKSATDELISKSSIPIHSHSSRYTNSMYIGLTALTLITISPVVTDHWSQSLSGIIFEAIGFPWSILAPVYLISLFFIPLILTGNELRKSFVQTLFIYLALLLIVAVFYYDKFILPFLSNDPLVLLQACLLVVTTIILFSYSLIKYIMMRKK